MERVLQLADRFGSGSALQCFIEVGRACGLQVRGYRFSITLTPPSTLAVARVAFGPTERPRGQVETWVNPAHFEHYFPAVAKERFQSELSGLRGEMLDGTQLEALAQRLLRVLKPVPTDRLGAMPTGKTLAT